MAPKESSGLLSTIPGALIAWGLPIATLILAIGILHPVKTWIWVAALVWMGSACLWNARRCKRRHCFWIGPFFLAMALAVLAHGYGLLDLGSQGWKWLGVAIGVGAWDIAVVRGSISKPPIA